MNAHQSTTIIRPAEKRDIASIAQIHFKSLSGTFISLLGSGYLTSRFFPKVIASQYGKTFVAEVEGSVCGYITIATNGKLFEDDISKLSFLDYILILSATVKHPQIARDLFAIIIGSKFNFCDDFSVNIFHQYELFAIAISPLLQNRGIGFSLMKHAFEEMGINQENNHSCYVKTHSLEAEKFYVQKGGFKRIGTETRGSTKFKILFRY